MNSLLVSSTCYRISSPNSSAFNPIVCRADSRESTDAKDLQWTEGDTARLTSNLKIHMQLYQQDMANVIQDEREKGKRRSHQLLLFPMHTKFCLVVFLQHLQIMKNHV
eukprot:XP_022259174.1 uncharacterized protein LOC106559780 [Canis lupus familiaris]